VLLGSTSKKGLWLLGQPLVRKHASALWLLGLFPALLQGCWRVVQVLEAWTAVFTWHGEPAKRHVPRQLVPYICKSDDQGKFHVVFSSP
jgi:hypothetical protein